MRMLRLGAVVAVAFTSCRQPAESRPPGPAAEPVPQLQPQPQTLWATSSPQGRAGLEAQRTDTGCTIACSIGRGAPVWTVDTCLATADDLRFVSDDCVGAIFLYPLPEKAANGKGLLLMRRLVNGVVEIERTDVDLMLTASARRGRWLGGVNGELGTRPRYSPDGKAVEFQVMTNTGRADQRFPLAVQNDDRFAVDAVHQTGGGSRHGMYSWEDDQGATQFADGLDQVPKKFRARAKPVAASVSVVVGQQREEPAQLAIGELPNEMKKKRVEAAPFPTTPEPARPTLPRDWVPPTGASGPSIDQFVLMRNGKVGFIPRGEHPVPAGSTCQGSGASCSNRFQCCSGSCSGGTCQ